MQAAYILDFHSQKFPDLVRIIDELRVYKQERLWKQLSDTLLQYMKDERIQQETHLKDLYEQFVKEFYFEIDELKLVRFLIKASDQYGEMQTRIDFLAQFKSLSEQQALLILKLKSAYYTLLQGKVEEADELMKNLKVQVERLQEPVESLVYSLLYYLAYNFFRGKKNYELFYNNALQYLAYTPDTEMGQEEKVNLSFEMALATLISPSIFNYSELLSQPVLVSLKQSQYGWVYSFVEVFNKGNVQQFEQLLHQHHNQIQQQPLLANNIKILEEKIRIMAFLELAFQLPKNNRVCSFEQISQVTLLEQDKVESLVIRTLSKNLVRGYINQVNQTVQLTYIIPRVLTKDKIEIMAQKFDNWEKTLLSLQGSLDDYNKQLN